MAHPYHHSLSGVKKWGGTVDDYIRIHDWFNESKKIIADFRHRSPRHHAEGIFMAEAIFGSTITTSNGRVVPVRWIGEQHVQEDLGFIPSFADWARAIAPKPWMGRTQSLTTRNLPESGAGNFGEIGSCPKQLSSVTEVPGLNSQAPTVGFPGSLEKLSTTALNEE